MKVSVIIPAYNEPEGLKITLDSLIQQSLSPNQYEIIVVDNGSKDHTFDVAADYADRYSGLVHALKEHDIQGSYAARNKGIAHARANILCFIDADMTVEQDYLRKVLAYFDNEELDYLGCKVAVYTEHNTLAAKYNQLNGFKVSNELSHNQYVPTCCLSVRKAVFDRVGLFDHRLESGGDFEFGQRVFRAGLGQQYADDILLLHPARWKYRSLVNKSKRVARGICQLSVYYPEKYQKNILKYFSYRRHLPKNPFSIMRKAKKEGVQLNMAEALALAFFHVPITFASSAEVRRYLKRQGWSDKVSDGLTLKTLS
jgi:glycosyltransferase involved in cell wall biosynthesis